MHCANRSIIVAVLAIFISLSPHRLFAAGAEVHISLPRKIEVSGAQVFVNDIATVSSPNLSLLMRVLELPLGKAPGSNDFVSLERKDLERWLRHAGRISASQISWSGSQVVQIGRSDNAVNARKQSFENRTLNFGKSDDPTSSQKVGDWVDAESRDGPVVLTSKAQVLKEGRVGDLIQVKLQHSNAIVPATISKLGTVEVLQ